MSNSSRSTNCRSERAQAFSSVPSTEKCSALNSRFTAGRPSSDDRKRCATAEAFVEGLKAKGIAPHVAVNGAMGKRGKVRKTAVPPQTVASAGYAISQRLRKRIEEIFGWGKSVGGLAQLKVRGLDKVRAVFVFAAAAYSIVRLRKLLAPTGEVCLAA
jgi:hypothetical protein